MATYIHSLTALVQAGGGGEVVLSIVRVNGMHHLVSFWGALPSALNPKPHHRLIRHHGQNKDLQPCLDAVKGISDSLLNGATTPHTLNAARHFSHTLSAERHNDLCAELQPFADDPCNFGIETHPPYPGLLPRSNPVPPRDITSTPITVKPRRTAFY